MMRRVVCKIPILVAVLVACFYQDGIAVASCPPEFLFGAPTTFSVTNRYVAGAVADFNADGAQDMAVIGSGFGAVNVFFGLRTSEGPTGTLIGPIQIAGGTNYTALAEGDFNSDGIPDVAALIPGAVTVVLGASGPAGSTPLGPLVQSTIPLTGTPAGAAAADVNGDGLLDLVISGQFQGGTMAVLLGNGQPPTGSGSFHLDQIYASAGGGQGIALADFNGDGILDAATVSYGDPGYIRVLEGRGTSGVGDGTFATGFVLPGGPVPYDLVAVDIDGDGQTDLAASNATSSGAVTVLLNTSTLPFGPESFSAPVLVAAGANPFRMTAADFNHDGRIDLALGTTDGVALLQSRSSSPVGSVEFSPVSFVATSREFSYVGTGDFNGDGRMDVAATGTQVLEPGSFYYITTTLLNDCLPPADASPTISEIQDIPLDQGGRVKISWRRSGYDREANPRVAEYWIWRSVLTQGISNSTAMLASPRDGSSWNAANLRSAFTTDSLWEFVASQPASGFAGYSYIARTPYDSTGMANPHTTFLVQARSSDGQAWFNSEIDSGYSVDNIAPRRPRGVEAELLASHTVRIHWQPNDEADLSHYLIHRGYAPDFIPSVSNEVASTPDSSFVDEAFSARVFYKVRALDIHGNSSTYALVGPREVSDVDTSPTPKASYLRQNYPNPFNPNTVLEFGMPISDQGTLRIYDARGALVRTLFEGLASGAAQWLAWDGRNDSGEPVPSGVYVAQLQASGIRRSVKMVLMR